MRKFLSNFGNIIGGFLIGLSFPTGTGLLIHDRPLVDCLVLIPGLFLLGLSYHYKFVDKSWHK